MLNIYFAGWHISLQLDAKQVENHWLNQCWLCSLTYIYNTWPKWVNGENKMSYAYRISKAACFWYKTYQLYSVKDIYHKVLNSWSIHKQMDPKYDRTSPAEWLMHDSSQKMSQISNSTHFYKQNVFAYLLKHINTMQHVLLYIFYVLKNMTPLVTWSLAMVQMADGSFKPS